MRNEDYQNKFLFHLIDHLFHFQQIFLKDFFKRSKSSFISIVGAAGFFFFKEKKNKFIRNKKLKSRKNKQTISC